MKKGNRLLLLMSLLILTCCTPSQTNDRVNQLQEKAILSKNQFEILQEVQVPRMDEDNYWIFGTFINNYTDSYVIIDMKSGLKIFYKDGGNWFETGNHEIVYQNEWEIPPHTIESYPSYLFVRPNIRREDVTFRIFLIGTINNIDQDQVVGMMEYVIKDNNLEEVNSIE